MPITTWSLQSIWVTPVPNLDPQPIQVMLVCNPNLTFIAYTRALPLADAVLNQAGWHKPEGATDIGD
ncbi:hypothetical protein FRC11_004752, partial [Ceratobasidium sp. 423]